jgi:hypothetical protein
MKVLLDYIWPLGRLPARSDGGTPDFDSEVNLRWIRRHGITYIRRQAIFLSACMVLMPFEETAAIAFVPMVAGVHMLGVTAGLFVEALRKNLPPT